MSVVMKRVTCLSFSDENMCSKKVMVGDLIQLFGKGEWNATEGVVTRIGSSDLTVRSFDGKTEITVPYDKMKGFNILGRGNKAKAYFA